MCSILNFLKCSCYYNFSLQGFQPLFYVNFVHVYFKEINATYKNKSYVGEIPTKAESGEKRHNPASVTAGREVERDQVWPITLINIKNSSCQPLSAGIELPDPYYVTKLK